jgi:predicted transcriptional regulator
MNKSQAREEIISLFNYIEEDIYPSEISEKLGIDYELVWEIIKELSEEGFLV